MKKGKVFTKGQIAVFLMVLGLAGAVWLNIKYSGNDKFLGQATYVNKKGGVSSEKTVATSAKAEQTDYFENAKKERDEAFDKAQETAEETLKSANITESEKEKTLESVKMLSNRIASAQNIESLLSAKGFKKSVAIISENGINIVVKSDNLSEAETIQIQDIVLSNSDFELKNIKIITVK